MRLINLIRNILASILMIPCVILAYLIALVATSGYRQGVVKIVGDSYRELLEEKEERNTLC